MFFRWSRLWTLLCLLLVIQQVSGEIFRLAPRQDEEQPRKTTAIESDTKTRESEEPTKTEASVKKTEARETTSAEAESKTGSVSVTTTESEGTETETADATSTSGVLEEDDGFNSTLYNATVPAGQLPITPVLTPGWGVAGTILLLTGIAHALVGIRNRMVHTFFSTAFSAALGVTVLIVYVMKPEVSDGLQGGYVVAVVLSGCLLGAASMFFREITEGLGCALGGFCVSMWLLCLVPGGLLGPVASKAIFIACFTLGGFVFYFSHYTRDWALILMISFSGATVTVIGIDAFSRAGLKEFWAYVWDLNDDLFPLGADTYPVTKGIRVETAAIIIIFLFGIVSQIKLWKVVREKREKKAEEEAEGQRNLREEEENVGRNIEAANARERRQWERVYGDGDIGSSTASRTSDDGEISTEKKHRDSQTDSSKRQSASIVEVIEMTTMTDPEPPKKPAPVSLMSAEQDMDGRVTVRVASDDIARPLSQVDEKASTAHHDTLSVANESVVDRRVSQSSSAPRSPAPQVIPLPFTIPVAADDDDAISDAERSSVATFADDEDAEPPTPGHRQSLAKRLSRLSRGSMELLGNISHRSSRVLGEDHEHGHGHSGSTEDLVIPRSRPRDDDGSVAATVDDESLSAGDHRSLPGTEPPKSIEINAEFSGKDEHSKLSPTPSHQTKFLEVDTASSAAKRSKAEHSEEQASEALDKAKSATSGSSARVSLTKDRLPRSLSKVALSYRTNEWAKHLSNADAPVPDEIHIDVPRSPAVPTIETPAPVHVNELQKSANEGTPAPAIARSDSQVSSMSHSASRRSVRQNVPAALAILNGEGQNRSPGTTPTSAGVPRSASMGLRRTSNGIEPIAEERDAPSLTPPIPEGQAVRSHSLSPAPMPDAQRSSTPGLVSYSSPQTLLGQREMYLRNKSQGNLLANPSEVSLNNPYRASSDAGSLHNYAMYAAGVGADVDDLPLSQRKQLMRQSSLNPSTSTPSLQRLSGGSGSGGIGVNSSEAPFDSHQPKRVSTLPTSAEREARMANFRESVRQDRLAGAPVVNSTGRETPFTPMSLLAGRETEVQRNVEMSRNILMSQKEAEAQRREMEQREKEWNDRAFDERMRSGDLLGIHREAMRKMQRHAKDK
ncbi:hypothetical protein CEP51_000730 [Fusarium floridanum]|uniref:TM7S3/TM198-like domain-containing protein n=1 Tax=Fusarium floridanum TaxID=1325733 RepID=A0A428SL72_9HYPO|nr:hypothetical protein CEP51_000730 [Fusarium floridanum]